MFKPVRHSVCTPSMHMAAALYGLPQQVSKEQHAVAAVDRLDLVFDLLLECGKVVRGLKRHAGKILAFADQHLRAFDESLCKIAVRNQYNRYQFIVTPPPLLGRREKENLIFSFSLLSLCLKRASKQAYFLALLSCL